MSDFDKKLKRSISDVKRGIKNLRSLGLKIKLDKNVETMIGTEIDNIYVTYSVVGTKGTELVILQKFLFTVIKHG